MRREIENQLSLFDLILNRAEPDAVECCKSEEIWALRAAASAQAMQICERYREKYKSAKLVGPMLRYKLDSIKKASTKAELKEIVRPALPRYDGGKFVPSKFLCSEEELIWRSMASLRGPLISEAQDRFELLFNRIYGEDALAA